MAKKSTISSTAVEIPTPVFTTSSNFVLLPEYMEAGDSLSMTVPDQSMEMRTIYARFAQGRPLDGSVKEPLYYGEDMEVPDIKKLDLTEIGEVLEESRNRVSALKDQLLEENENANRIEQERIARLREEEDKRLLDLVYKERKQRLDER